MPSEDQKTDIIDLAGKVTGLTVFLYLLGFVTINAHLAKWGVYTFELLSVQYLAAGFVTAIAFTIFGFSVGRRLYYLDHDFNNFAGLGKDYRWPRLWTVFCWTFVLVEVVFAGVVATVWTATLFFRNTKVINGLVEALTLVFIFDFLLLVRPGIYKRKAYIALPLSFIAFLGAIAGSWGATQDSRMLALFLLYAVAGMVWSFIFQVRSVTKVFLWFWASITILTTASVFGSFVYGHVRRSIGGGEPSHAKLILMNEAPQTLKSVLGVKVDETRPVAILGETASEVVVIPADAATDSRQAFRVKRALIAGIISVKDDDEADFHGGESKKTTPK